MTEIEQQLCDFVKQFEADKSPRPLKEHLAEELLKQIMRGEREISALIQDPNNGNIFVCFSFTK